MPKYRKNPVRKPLSSVRPSRKFFVVAAAPNAAFAMTTFLFMTSLRFVDKNPIKAKRFYSKTKALVFLDKAAPNPNMKFKVYRMLETLDGLSIHTL